jgi:trehalose utilization protein
MSTLKLAICLLSLAFSSYAAEAVHVLIWDERQPQQALAYDNFIGNEIAARLKKSTPDLEVRSVGIDDPEQGLSATNLDWADVVIWWGHARQLEISPSTIKQKFMKRLRTGQLDLIALHSAHFATPFMEAMNERTMIEARRKFPTPKDGRPVVFEFVGQDGRVVPDRQSLVTPAYYVQKKGGKIAKVRVDLPNCCFPSYRPDGKPSTLKTVMPEHPIAKGVAKTISIPATEMYDEPFHVPTPDELIFEETWATGERFRSGMVWNLGKGKIFYFRPGHETYPVFKQDEVIQILANACSWLGAKPATKETSK